MICPICFPPHDYEMRQDGTGTNLECPVCHAHFTKYGEWIDPEEKKKQPRKSKDWDDMDAEEFQEYYYGGF